MIDTRQCTSVLMVWPCNADTIEWVGQRGFTVMSIGTEYMAIRIPHVCPHYDPRKNTCELDTPPAWCRQYPEFIRAAECRHLGLDLHLMLQSPREIRRR